MREHLCVLVHVAMACIFMVSTGGVCTSAGGACSFVVDAGVVGASVVARVVCTALCPRRCPWLFPPYFVGGSVPFPRPPPIPTGPKIMEGDLGAAQKCKS